MSMDCLEWWAYRHLFICWGFGLCIRAWKLCRVQRCSKRGGAAVCQNCSRCTKVQYNPGTLLGGEFEHDCSLDRCISYFLEPLIFFGLFGQKPLSLRLKGITNAYMERSVDTFKMSILHILKHFSVPLGSFELEIEKRGYPPLGDGVVVLKVINLPLAGTIWTDAGVIQSIRGLIYSTSVNTEYDGRMINAARTIFKDFTPDVHIYTDPKKGPFVGRSKGYGITVVAETSTRCYISADFMINSPIAVEAPRMPEEVIDRVASMLRDELLQSGVVDSKSQGFLFLLCALANGYSKIRVGELTVDGKETLEIIKDFLGERFFSKDDPTTATVLLRFRGR